MPRSTGNLKPIIVYVDYDTHAVLAQVASGLRVSISQVAREPLVAKARDYRRANVCPECGASGEEPCIEDIRDRPRASHESRARKVPWHHGRGTTVL